MKPERRVRIEANAFELLIAFLCALSALAYFLVPDYLEESAIGQATAIVRYVWVTLLAASAGFITTGLWNGRGDLEAAGLVCLATASALQAIALALTIGGGSLTSIGTFAAVAWACIMRLRLLIRES